jgi:DNA (cytosine-5)-methyltransferase 1
MQLKESKKMKNNNKNKSINIATVFSGIGAVEESFKQLNIPSNIIFACDNGERDPKCQIKLLLKVARETLSQQEATTLSNRLIEKLFKIKNNNLTLAQSDNLIYNTILKSNENDKLDLAIEYDGKTIEIDNQKHTYQIDIYDIQEAVSFLDDEKIQLFINSWYETTGLKNYVKQSYFANYSIKESNWFEDIRFINGKKFAGKVDLIVGGSPCQSFSTYGKKRGLEDTRGTLFYDYARLISEIKPKVFIYENVRGLLTHDKKKTWNVIKDVFESLDYTIKYQVLNAKDYGLPQLRTRIFVVGIRNDIYNKDCFEFPKPIELNKKSTDYLFEDVDDKYYLGKKGFEWMTTPEKHQRRSRVNQDIIGCQTANQQDNWIGDFRIEKPKPQHYSDSRIYIGKFEGHDAVARKMTPTECIRLMGFENFKIVLDDKRIYRQAGNSIAVPVLNEIIKNLKPILNY